MAYVTDELWVEAKQVAKANGMANNWVEIVEYYHSLGGHRAMVHSIIADKQREILHVLDDESVLLIDSRSNLHIADYNDVLESKKLFFCKKVDNYETLELTIPQSLTYQGNNIIKVKVV